MKLWKYSGTFLTATGIIHTIYALFIGKDAFSEMLRNGLVNSIGENYSQGFAFWFLICGVILILLGQTLQYYIRKERKNLHFHSLLICVHRENLHMQLFYLSDL